MTENVTPVYVMHVGKCWSENGNHPLRFAFGLGQQIEAAGYKLALAQWIKEDLKALLNESERVDLPMLIEQEPRNH